MVEQHADQRVLQPQEEEGHNSLKEGQLKAGGREAKGDRGGPGEGATVNGPEGSYRRRVNGVTWLRNIRRWSEQHLGEPVKNPPGENE